MRIKVEVKLKRTLVAVFILLLSLAYPAYRAFASGSHMPIFDTTGKINGKPDLTAFGLSPMKIYYTSELWKPGEDRTEPDEAYIRALARKAPTDVPIVIDIEHWPLKGPELESSIDKFIHVGDWMHAENPKLKIGFYSIVPMPLAFYSNTPGAKDPYFYFESKEHPTDKNGAQRAAAIKTQWEGDNVRMRRLAQHVDFIAPALYTYSSPKFDYQRYWEPNAILAIQQAKQYGKPVYIFLWPQLDVIGDHPADLPFLPADYWLKELNVAKTYADGAIIWATGGYLSHWDANAPWWKATLQFMKNN